MEVLEAQIASSYLKLDFICLSCVHAFTWLEMENLSTIVLNFEFAFKYYHEI